MSEELPGGHQGKLVKTASTMKSTLAGKTTRMALWADLAPNGRLNKLLQYKPAPLW